MGNCRNYSMMYRFPYGQWCTSMSKVCDEVYAASFFDQNFALIKGQADQDNENNMGSYLEVIASSNLGE